MHDMHSNFKSIQYVCTVRTLILQHSELSTCQQPHAAPYVDEGITRYALDFDSINRSQAACDARAFIVTLRHLDYKSKFLRSDETVLSDQIQKQVQAFVPRIASLLLICPAHAHFESPVA